MDKGGREKFSDSSHGGAVNTQSGPTKAPEIEVSVDYPHCRHVAPIKRIVRADGRISVLVDGLDLRTEKEAELIQALRQIADMTPASTEMTQAHEMGQIASDVLARIEREQIGEPDSVYPAAQTVSGCSVCYGSGFDVVGKPCPFACRPASKDSA